LDDYVKYGLLALDNLNHKLFYLLTWRICPLCNLEKTFSNLAKFTVHVHWSCWSLPARHTPF